MSLSEDDRAVLRIFFLQKVLIGYVKLLYTVKTLERIVKSFVLCLMQKVHILSILQMLEMCAFGGKLLQKIVNSDL